MKYEDDIDFERPVLERGSIENTYLGKRNCMDMASKLMGTVPSGSILHQELKGYRDNLAFELLDMVGKNPWLTNEN